jgi:hypothetical protein
MRDLGSLGNRIAIVERKIRSNLVHIQRHIVLVGVDIHSSGNSSGGFHHGRLFLRRFVLGFA